MKNKKKFLTIISIIACSFIVVFFFIIGQREIISKVDKDWPDDGIYFMDVNAYMGCFTDEAPFIQLPIIYIHNKEVKNYIDSYNGFKLISNAEEINATFNNFLFGAETKEYSLYTLQLSLPNLESGIYEIDKIKLVDKNNNVSFYDIGNWIIDIRDGSNPNNIEIGKNTLASSYFEHYTTELKNKSDDVINIQRLYFEFKKCQYDVRIQPGNNFDMTSITDDLSIQKNEMKGFMFEFTENSDSTVDNNSFIVLKPFLFYSTEDKEYILSLPSAMYSPDVNEEKILNIIHNIR